MDTDDYELFCPGVQADGRGVLGAPRQAVLRPAHARRVLYVPWPRVPEPSLQALHHAPAYAHRPGNLAIGHASLGLFAHDPPDLRHIRLGHHADARISPKAPLATTSPVFANTPAGGTGAVLPAHTVISTAGKSGLFPPASGSAPAPSRPRGGPTGAAHGLPPPPPIEGGEAKGF